MCKYTRVKKGKESNIRIEEVQVDQMTEPLIGIRKKIQKGR